MRDRNLPLDIIDSCWSTDDLADLWDTGSDRSDELALMRSYVELLVEDYKELYIILYFNLQTQHQAARKLGISQPSVASRVASLAKCIKYLDTLPAISKKLYRDNIKLISSVKQKYAISYLKNPDYKYVASMYNVDRSAITKSINHTINNECLDVRFRAYLRAARSAPPGVARLPDIL